VQLAYKSDVTWNYISRIYQ